MKTTFISLIPLLACTTNALPHALRLEPASPWNVLQSALLSTWNGVETSFSWPEIVLDIFGHAAQPEYDAPDKSVYQWLANNDDFTKITKLINFDKDIVKLLDGASHGLTFLAPNNAALPDPHKKKNLTEIQLHDEDALCHLSAQADAFDDKEKKKLFKEILHKVLLYHVLPFDTTSTQLGLNSTVQTALRSDDGSFDGELRRVKIEHSVVTGTVINRYAKIISSDNKATNGIIQVIDNPLFPPPSVLDIAHILPQWLSTTTSAIQKVSLDDALHYHFAHGKHEKNGKFKGTPIVTFFAPNNEAWKKLPEKLIIYLFSPFGEKALRKLLSYHVVPDYAIFTEWIHRKGDDGLDAAGVELDFAFPFPTALPNHTLNVHIKKTTPTIPVPGVAYWEFHAQGEAVEDFDNVARNGVLHIIPTVLDPRNKDGKSEGHGWEDWEDWIPQWAESI